MPTLSRRPLTVTAKITVEIENASDWSDLLRQSLVEAFRAAIPAPRPVPAITPPPPVPTPPPRPSKVEWPQVKETPTETATDEPMLVNTRQAAKLLGVSERTLWGRAHSGAMPRPIKIGSSVRWCVAVLRDWIAAGCPTEEQWEKMKKGR